MNSRIVCLAILCAFAAISPIRAFADLSTNLFPSADTTLFENSPDNNLGSSSTLIVGTTAGGSKDRGLFKFDLSQLPVNATITSAAFSINVVKAGFGSGSTFAMHRVLRDWGEGTGLGNQGELAKPGEATWKNRFHPTIPWDSPGAATNVDFVGDVSATSFVDGSGSYTFGSTPALVADVQSWVGNAGTNFGWIVISDAEGVGSTARRVASREDSVSTPVLALQYTVSATPPPPTLFNLARVGNQIRFSFNTQSNHTYAVEFRDAFTNGNWNVLTNIPTLPADATLHITNAISGTQRYFRARTP